MFFCSCFFFVVLYAISEICFCDFNVGMVLTMVSTEYARSQYCWHSVILFWTFFKKSIVYNRGSALIDFNLARHVLSNKPDLPTFLKGLYGREADDIIQDISQCFSL